MTIDEVTILGKGAIEPFRVAVPEAELEDLGLRLAATRWPRPEPVGDWSQGVPLAYLRQLCEYWRGEYDWRRLEARLNALPQFRTEIDGVGIYFIHLRSAHEDALPLVLTHGWPGSVIEFLDAVDPLVEPTAHGGEPGDAFHVVCPALPGYGFSDAPTEAGWGPDRISRAWAELMARLGYSRYGAQGGDWGSAVTRGIARNDAEHVVGIHLNSDHIPRGAVERLGTSSEFEREALAARNAFGKGGTGYSRQQATRPQTLGYGLADSPAGQCAWIVEKFAAWSDSGGRPENAFSRDALLDNVSLYWLTDSAASSARIYWEAAREGATVWARAEGVPTAVSAFPHDINLASERWLADQDPGLVYHHLAERGGHFAAMEVPDLFVAEVRAGFRAIAASEG
jgi:pimeloyl-ACP methyl ester carboxylesterase